MIIKLSVLSVVVALVIPVRRCPRCIRGTRGLNTLRTRVLMTAGVTRDVLAALEMIELSPTELCPGPIGIT